jgi:hypothetical protein
MPIKYVALALALTGLALLCWAMERDSSSSFENGSFIGEIFLGGAGALLIVAGIIVFLVAVFIAA